MSEFTERQLKLQRLLRENSRRRDLPQFIARLNELIGQEVSEGDFLSLNESDVLVKRLYRFSNAFAEVSHDDMLGPYYREFFATEELELQLVLQRVFDGFSDSGLLLSFYSNDVGLLAVQKSTALKCMLDMVDFDGSAVAVFDLKTDSALHIEIDWDYNLQDKRTKGRKGGLYCLAVSDDSLRYRLND